MSSLHLTRQYCARGLSKASASHRGRFEAEAFVMQHITAPPPAILCKLTYPRGLTMLRLLLLLPLRALLRTPHSLAVHSSTGTIAIQHSTRISSCQHASNTVCGHWCVHHLAASKHRLSPTSFGHCGGSVIVVDQSLPLRRCEYYQRSHMY